MKKFRGRNCFFRLLLHSFQGCMTKKKKRYQDQGVIFQLGANNQAVLSAELSVPSELLLLHTGINLKLNTYHMKHWQLLETKLFYLRLPASLKTHRLTKQSKNAIYSDISNTKMPLDRDRLDSHQKVAHKRGKLSTWLFFGLFPLYIWK